MISCLGAEPILTKTCVHEEDEGRPTEETRKPRATQSKTGKGPQREKACQCRLARPALFQPEWRNSHSAAQREARENKETTLPVWLFNKQDSLSGT